MPYVFYIILLQDTSATTHKTRDRLTIIIKYTHTKPNTAFYPLTFKCTEIHTLHRH